MHLSPQICCKVLIPIGLPLPGTKYWYWWQMFLFLYLVFGWFMNRIVCKISPSYFKIDASKSKETLPLMVIYSQMLDYIRPLRLVYSNALEHEQIVKQQIK